MLESGFYQTSSIFPGSSAAGSGVARFTGGTSAGIKMIENSNYYGTVLTQSGSPSIHDQHRFSTDRRGVATSFWINKKKARTAGGLTSLQGVVGNLKLFSAPRYAASGEWGIYYIPSIAAPSGDTPFNSLNSMISVNSAGTAQVDGASEHLGGLMAVANTTAGGSMGKMLKTHDGEFIQATVPDTMIPLAEDRWYYMQFWWDTKLKTSFARVASPAKGIPGASGYLEEIKPITDKCQKWLDYEIKTDAGDIKLKVGGGLARESDVTPYYNLGYNIGGSEKYQEEFLIDELVVSNRVCTIAAMEEKFDLDYSNYIGQFSSNSSPSLFISGE